MDIWGGVSLEQKWIDWQAGYMAQPAEDIKTFPFHGASNLVLPVMATDVDTMFARLFGMILGADSIWTVAASSPEMEPIAPRIQEFLKWAQHNEIDLETPVGNWILEILKLGTGVLKQRYNRETKLVYEWRELAGGNVFQQQLVTLLKDAPAVHHVRLFDFWAPSGYTEIQDMPWCGEDIWLTWRAFMKRVQAGIYQGSDRLMQWDAQSKGSHIMQTFQQISGYAPSRGDKIGLREFWVDWDIGDSGYDQALVCTIHMPSRTYVRLDYNPFFNQDKPYSVSRFMRNENSFYGIGLGQMLDPFQEEATAMHNQRIDNGTIQNSQMFAVTKTNKHIREDEPIYPSKIWLVDKADDVKALPLGNSAATSAASINNESYSMQYAQRRTGVNDYVYGQPETSINYSTAYTTQQMISNSTRRQGEVLRGINKALGETGTRVLEMYQQFNQRGKEFFALGAQDGQLVRAVLQFPLDLLRRGLKVGVTAIDVELSKDSLIRQNTIILQQVMAYFQQVMQAAMMASNPQMPPMVRQFAIEMVQGSTYLTRQLLDSYGKQDLDKIIPDLAGGQNVLAQQLDQLQQLVILSGGPTGVGGTPLPSGMGDFAPGGIAGVPAPVGAGAGGNAAFGSPVPGGPGGGVVHGVPATSGFSQAANIFGR